LIVVLKYGRICFYICKLIYCAKKNTMKIKAGMVVFVTGGASGLGEATVRDLHAQGASVAIADMNLERM
jgi:NADP-dependent 3-hydroxy acid dehydrogenase YdfG